MTDEQRKITDEQVIKALECCTKKYGCCDCPLENDELCMITINKEALSLIKRQQSRIEQEVDLNREMFEKMARDEAEIETLEADREALINGQITLQKMYAEAIKKFAERLKNDVANIPAWGSVAAKKIDNLVKELTEGK